MRKETKSEFLTRLAPVEVYKLVARGKLKQFPKNYWRGEDAKSRSAEITRFLFEDVLRWTHEDIKTQPLYDLLSEYGLNGMIQTLFAHSPFRVVDNAYPNMFKPEDLIRCSHTYYRVA